ncbi:hypothetical protein [Micromonospora sp. NPDC047134]|uniref:hypothetical protein n=1 Tax=Micromonospora sp. NPDC047134 TaxID=3154340 RepID=UPI0033CF0088
MAPRELARRVLDAGTEGLTLLGGEPFDQSAALLAATDLLVAGPFEADRIDTARPWVGSTNQEFVLLSDRFPGLLDELSVSPDRVEITVDPAGRVAVNG